MSLNLVSEVGNKSGLLVALPVEEVRREPGRVFVRTIAPPDEPPGVPVYEGEQVVFEPGAVRLDLDEIDRYYGQHFNDEPLAPVLWVWLQIGRPPKKEALLFVMAAARRLDVALRLLKGVSEHVDRFHRILNDNGFGPELQTQFAAGIGDLEVAIVALGRAADMTNQLRDHFPIAAALNVQSVATLASLRDIRNAYEHIEDRALGQVQRKPHADAHTAFDHHPIFVNRVIQYGQHSVTITALVALAADVRETLKSAAAEIASPP